MGNRQANNVANSMWELGYRLVAALAVCLLFSVCGRSAVALAGEGDPPRPGAGKIAEATSAPRQVAQCRLFREMAEELDNPLEQVQALIAAAECSLARECAEPISVIWSGEAAGRDVAARQLRFSANLAREDLTRAAGILDGRGETDGDKEDMVRRTREQAETLQAFTAMFDAIGSAVSAGMRPTTQPTSNEAARKELISACHGLAPCLDSADEGVVTAARFYQGLAYRLAGRPDRTAVVIKRILAKPRFMRLGLMARLEFCRALGAQGEHATALVLCMRLGRLSDEWFGDESADVQSAAQATVLAVRVELLNQWVEALEAAGEKDEAKEIGQQIRQLEKKRGAPSAEGSWLCLDRAIPGGS